MRSVNTYNGEMRWSWTVEYNADYLNGKRLK